MQRLTQPIPMPYTIHSDPIIPVSVIVSGVSYPSHKPTHPSNAHTSKSHLYHLHCLTQAALAHTAPDPDTHTRSPAAQPYFSQWPAGRPRSGPGYSSWSPCGSQSAATAPAIPPLEDPT